MRTLTECEIPLVVFLSNIIKIRLGLTELLM